jgi:tRNA pseudouridine55 synthase
MDGILLIDKPEGWTSFDVVNYVRGIVANIENKKPRHIKVGHTGTLDPGATGLLVLCIGKATKSVPQLIKQDKTYQVEVTLGETSTTGDKEGEIKSSENVSDKELPSVLTIKTVLDTFLGEIEQVPPAYSAIKVNGKRAYEMAREGKSIELKPRTVRIYSIDDIKYKYPKLSFLTSVASGTYIRSLAKDIGDKLGCGAYMSNLRRVKVGEYSLSEAHAISEINNSIEQKLLITNRCRAIMNFNND